jgi:EmrB/QacA subfamily drug resistance transporter
MASKNHLQTSSSSDRSRIVIFGAVLLGLLLAALNMTVVSTALPRIAAELQGLQYYSWVFTLYLITAAATMPIFGKLSDMYGRKKFFILGIVILLVGAVLAGTSRSMVELAMYRGIQGIGAGAIIPISMAIVSDLFPPSEQGKWRAMTQGVFTVASLGGPLVGGLATDLLSWRWVFYLLLPPGIIALVMAAVVMPPHRRDGVIHRVDYWGAAVLLLGIVPLLFGFSWAGNQYDWGSVQVLSMFAMSGMMCVVFVWIELRAAEPILPLGLFRNPIFVISLFCFFLIGLGLFGTISYLPFFVQAIGGETATNSGLLLLPMSVTGFAAGVIGGQILTRWGRYKALAVFSTGTTALGLFLVSRIGVDTGNSIIVLYMVVVGVGIGIAFPLFTIIVQNAVPQNVAGVAVSSAAFIRNLGGTIGTAVQGSVVSGRFFSYFQENVPSGVVKAVEDSGTDIFSTPQALLDPRTMAKLESTLAEAGGPGTAAQVLETMRVSLAMSMNQAFFLGALALAVAFIATLFLREIPLRQSNMTEGESEK